MKMAIVVVVLLFGNSAFANEYIFVGFFGQIYSMQDNGKVEMLAPSFLHRSGIEECMYSIDKGEIAVNIIDMSWRLHTFGAESRITGKYSMNIHKGNMCEGIFYDYKEQEIATAAVLRKSVEKDRRFVRNGVLLKDERSTDTISNIDSCLSIHPRILRTALPHGEFDKEAFALRHKNNASRIRISGEKWYFTGQSKRWLCYTGLPNRPAGKLREDASYIIDRITNQEYLYTRDGEFGIGYVYPDVVLFKVMTRINGSSRPDAATGKLQVQLPNESALREFEIDPAARLLWANSKSIFYQVERDVMRYEYINPENRPVIIWEGADTLFCMFEKDSILNALKE